MFENKYNSETHTKETEYVPVPETTSDKGSKKVIKAVAALCLTAAVAVGSVAGYRYFTEKDENTNVPADKNIITSLPEDSQNNASENTSDADYEVSSLFQLSKTDESLTTQEVYQKVLPSVVGITSVFKYESGSSMMSMFGYGQTTESEVTGTGTGIVMSADGYVITNAHVIYEAEYGGKAKTITVMLSNEDVYEADVIGFDTQTDIAVLKVKEAPALTPAEFGDSSSLQVGDTAIAIGNPLGFDLFGTLTVGYISGLNREISMEDTVMHLIQTDAAINNGNSGGPLVNDKGQVIGINSMKMSNTYSSSEASIEGLGFAIPMNEALEIVNELMNNGYVTGRPQLGISCQDVSSAQVSGARVLGMNENGAAEKAGLEVGDIIVAANGQQIESTSELTQVKNQFKAGDTLKLTVIRDNKYVEIEVVLEETPAATDEEEATEESSDASQEENQNDSNNSSGFGDNGTYEYGNGNNGYGYSFGYGNSSDPFSWFGF